MAGESVGSTSGGATVIDSNAQPAREVFPNLLSAISQIQRYAMIEREGGDLPLDFLTIEGQVDYFRIGVGSGLLHGIIFLVLTIIILPITSDDILHAYISQFVPLAEYKSFLFFLNLTPVLFSVMLCMYLCKYHIGTITRRSIDSLLWGRLASKISQGVLYFLIFIMLAKLLTPENAWIFSYNISFRNYDIAAQIYRVIMNTRPNLYNTAFEVFAVFIIAIAVPFFTIWMFSSYRRVQRFRQKIFWNN